MSLVILVIGVAASGKSWVCRQLTDRFDYLAHDRCWEHPDFTPADLPDAPWGPPGSVSRHLEMLALAAQGGARPVISEVPFGESELMRRLRGVGVDVLPVFVVEEPKVIMTRYYQREKRSPPMEVLTRAGRLQAKAERLGAFFGTSDEILAHLQQLGQQAVDGDHGQRPQNEGDDPGGEAEDRHGQAP
jgi:hypothetical protein